MPTSLAFLSQEIRVMRGYDCTNHAKDVQSGIVISEYSIRSYYDHDDRDDETLVRQGLTLAWLDRLSTESSTALLSSKGCLCSKMRRRIK